MNRSDTALRRLRRRAGELPLLASLRGRLILLVLIAVMPAGALVVYTAIEQRQLGLEVARENVLRMARLAAQRQDERIEGGRQLLITLSHLKEVAALDQEACETFLEQLMEIHGIYANLGVILPNGEVFASGVPVMQPMNLGDRRYFREALSNRTFAIGDYQVGRITGKPSLNLGYPVLLGSNHVIAVVYAALDLSWFPNFVRETRLPAGSSLTITDREGVTLARYPDPEGTYVGQRVGRTPPPHFPGEPGPLKPPPPERWRVGRGRDGVLRLYALKTLAGHPDDPRPASMALGIPVGYAHAEANHALRRNLAWLALATLVMVGLAWWVGDFFIVRRIHDLLHVTERVTTGDLSARTGVTGSHGELRQLAHAFDEMTVALETREQERNRAQAKLETMNVELERRVDERTLELKRSNQDLEQFAYVASHDLQEPLRMVNTYMQLLEQRYAGRLDTDAREFIGFAVDGAQRMQQLIEDLLAYSRIGTRGRPFAPVETNAIFDRALTNLRLAIQESGAAVTRDDLPVVFGDAAQLTQLFQNLVSNALKFRRDEPPKVHVSARWLNEPVKIPGAGDEGPGRRGCEFAVRDNGIGIPAQDCERIFVLFQRLHQRDQYPGTGIGLSICKKIVERHGGRIWVTSERGKGSTFYFVLPGSEKSASLQTRADGA